ncbi:UNKNOWN [Stylonychia lemnae]|uniref:PB1 domain-containing protein n=1 Tax=Stylonychia lemnae TaxID=5949 RepID=A0A078AQC5_STYLE|nr:UNKNOWN [Stylonychia lemnae]|eukprot:CDW84615.1 UNKNOWN [Stylonychia lemnae]
MKNMIKQQNQSAQKTSYKSAPLAFKIFIEVNQNEPNIQKRISLSDFEKSLANLKQKALQAFKSQINSNNLNSFCLQQEDSEHDWISLKTDQDLFQAIREQIFEGQKQYIRLRLKIIESSQSNNKKHKDLNHRYEAQSQRSNGSDGSKNSGIKFSSFNKSNQFYHSQILNPIKPIHKKSISDHLTPEAINHQTILMFFQQLSEINDPSLKSKLREIMMNQIFKSNQSNDFETSMSHLTFMDQLQKQAFSLVNFDDEIKGTPVWNQNKDQINHTLEVLNKRMEGIQISNHLTQSVVSSDKKIFKVGSSARSFNSNQKKVKLSNFIGDQFSDPQQELAVDNMNTSDKQIVDNQYIKKINAISQEFQQNGQFIQQQNLQNQGLYRNNHSSQDSNKILGYNLSDEEEKKESSYEEEERNNIGNNPNIYNFQKHIQSRQEPGMFNIIQEVDESSEISFLRNNVTQITQMTMMESEIVQTQQTNAQ